MRFKSLPAMSGSIREDSEVQKREIVRTTVSEHCSQESKAVLVLM
jgi:hypothetical protein